MADQSYSIYFLMSDTGMYNTAGTCIFTLPIKWRPVCLGGGVVKYKTVSMHHITKKMGNKGCFFGLEG